MKDLCCKEMGVFEIKGPFYYIGEKPVIFKHHIYAKWDEFEIKYCPFCGAKL